MVFTLHEIGILLGHILPGIVILGMAVREVDIDAVAFRYLIAHTQPPLLAVQLYGQVEGVATFRMVH